MQREEQFPEWLQPAREVLETNKSDCRQSASKLGPKTPGSKKPSKASEKEAKRRQKAIEKQFSRTERELTEQGRQTAFPLTDPVSSRPLQNEPLAHQGAAVPQAWPPEGAGELSPLLSPQDSNEAVFNPFSCPATTEWQHASNNRNSVPEATFTPTAAGLRQRKNRGSELPADIKLIISQAIS